MDRAFHSVIYFKNGAIVPAVAAVVWCAEYGNELPVAKKLIPFIDQLVGAAYQVKIVVLAECLHDLTIEEVRDAPVAGRPSVGDLVRI